MTIAIGVIGAFAVFLTGFITLGFCAEIGENQPNLALLAIINLFLLIALFVLALVK